VVLVNENKNLEKEISSHLESSCQGLAFWLGYQEERSRRHPICEIAIVTELFALLDAKLALKQFRAHCETIWSELLRNKQLNDSKKMLRVAITISEDQHMRFAIEIKNINGQVTQAASASWIKDLKKLCELK
jgi:hypothetical protein